MANQGSSTQQTGRSKTFGSARQPTAAQALAARQLFGSFRKGEANDPETYVASVLTVLMDYDDEVVREICHPGRGLPSRCDFLPTVKELKEACEAEAARRARMAKYAELPRYEPKRLPRPPAQPGAWANMLVIKTDHRHDRLVELTKNMDPRLWRVDEQERGIWVALSMIEEKAAELQRFKGFTDAQLRKMYPPREAPAPATDEAAA